MPALVEDDDAIAVGQGRELPAHAVPVAGQSVGEDQGRTVAESLGHDFQPVGGDP